MRAAPSDPQGKTAHAGEQSSAAPLEPPAEHLKNALQILATLVHTSELAAVTHRIRLALEQLERPDRELFDTAAQLQKLLGELTARSDLPAAEADDTFYRAGRLVGTLLHAARPRGAR